MAMAWLGEWLRKERLHRQRIREGRQLRRDQHALAVAVAKKARSIDWTEPLEMDRRG